MFTESSRITFWSDHLRELEIAGKTPLPLVNESLQLPLENIPVSMNHRVFHYYSTKLILPKRSFSMPSLPTSVSVTALPFYTLLIH